MIYLPRMTTFQKVEQLTIICFCSQHFDYILLLRRSLWISTFILKKNCLVNERNPSRSFPNHYILVILTSDSIRAIFFNSIFLTDPKVPSRSDRWVLFLAQWVSKQAKLSHFGQRATRIVSRAAISSKQNNGLLWFVS